MSDPIDDIITAILGREGSAYTDRATDRGGPTKYGVTLATFSLYRRAAMTAADLMLLSEEEAREIYRKLFVIDPGFDHITEPKLRELAVDSGVQHGPERVTKWLQIAVGVDADGQWGPLTESAVNARDPRALFADVLAQRVEFYGRLVTADPTQAANDAGWMARVATFIRRLA